MAKKFNVDSNVYIILYSVVMVVVVAALLAVVSLSLQGRQNDNALNEKKQQIVTALGEDPLTTEYASHVATPSWPRPSCSTLRAIRPRATYSRLCRI